MLEVNGESLLERAIKALVNANINKLILVIGYKMDNLKNYIKDKRRLKINYRE